MLRADLARAVEVLQSAHDEKMWGEITFTIKNGEIKLARLTKTIPFDGRPTNGTSPETVHD